MNIRFLEGIEGAKRATGHVVVVDVLRAFTTAAYAIVAGLEDIVLTSTVAEAFRQQGFRMGEVDGRFIPGFDHGNSPSGFEGRRLRGTGVLRTTAGTPCVLAAGEARTLWLGSLVVAGATARMLRHKHFVTFVLSGAPEGGEEDRACAEYIASLLAGSPLPQRSIVETVRGSRAAARFLPDDKERPLRDLDFCTSIDKFDFAIRVDLRGTERVAASVRAPE